MLQLTTALVQGHTAHGLSTQIFHLNFWLNLVCVFNSAQSSLSVCFISPFSRAVIYVLAGVNPWAMPDLQPVQLWIFFFCCYFAYKVEISGGQACPIIPLLIKKWHVPIATTDIYGPDKGIPFLQPSGWGLEPLGAALGQGMSCMAC